MHEHGHLLVMTTLDDIVLPVFALQEAGFFVSSQDQITGRLGRTGECMVRNLASSITGDPQCLPEQGIRQLEDPRPDSMA